MVCRASACILELSEFAMSKEGITLADDVSNDNVGLAGHLLSSSDYASTLKSHHDIW